MIQPIASFEQYQQLYEASVNDPESFWNEQAQQFVWKKNWDKVLDWEFQTPSVKWFVNGQLNITDNVLDRHVTNNPNKVAIHWEPNDPNKPNKVYTYLELFEAVCKSAAILKDLGIKKGDRVIIYMPMIPELLIHVLACARIGAIHSVVFAGFSASALADRINDCKAEVVITTDGANRGNKQLNIKSIVDEALVSCPVVKNVLVVTHTQTEMQWNPMRDVHYHEVINQVKPIYESVAVDAEDPLFILYTSGSTGKPKGVLHTTGGYMVYAAYSFAHVFNVQQNDVFFCTADIGWITGHTYLAYGPLLQGATQVMFEGIPTYPDASRFWQIIDKYQVSHFYTAPTAIRSLMSFGTDILKPYALNSLKILGSVGEPINEEAWEWYHKNIGKENCPIVDTWWQTETGGILIAPLSFHTPLKPCYATLPLPGIQPVIVDAEGKELEGDEVEGNLCIKYPWPSIIRTTYGDHERCKQTYFSTYPNLYFTGDGCKRDIEGYYRILGRVDDVMNVSGHRMGTAEVENAINEDPNVIESAVVGFPHEIKGQGIYAFVITDLKEVNEPNIIQSILSTVTKVIGPIAKPDKIQIVSGLPKTRSGKIMRRILRKVAEGDISNLGDTSTLLDPSVVEEIIKGKK
jgi:acetyl-CoA synthetase